jgi:hypothetical protein
MATFMASVSDPPDICASTPETLSANWVWRVWRGWGAEGGREGGAVRTDGPDPYTDLARLTSSRTFWDSLHCFFFIEQKTVNQCPVVEPVADWVMCSKFWSKHANGYTNAARRTNTAMRYSPSP